MVSVRCTVILQKDKNRKVDVELRKENNGQLLWKVIKSSGGNMRLAATEGTWEVVPREMLSLWYEPKGRDRNPVMKNLITLIVFDVKDDFMEDIVKNGNVLEMENAGLYNDNPTEKEVTCRLARMN